MKEEIKHLKKNIETMEKESSNFFDKALKTLATAIFAPVILAVEAVKGISSLL